MSSIATHLELIYIINYLNSLLNSVYYINYNNFFFKIDHSMRYKFGNMKYENTFLFQLMKGSLISFAIYIVIPVALMLKLIYM